MKKEHSIFKAIVQVDNQQDCDIAREICERYSLPTWNDVTLAFKYVDYGDNPTYLQHQPDDRTADEDHIGFYVDNLDGKDEDDYNVLSIEEFEALANDYNPQFDNMEDILSTMKELNNLLNNK
jgi:hypothetical protein